MTSPPYPIPHHYQGKEHTCGPAAMNMVLDAILGAPLSEAELEEWLATDAKIGTRQRTLAAFVERVGLQARALHTETTLDDLRELLRGGHIVVVLYHLADAEETFDHYAVIQRITDTEVVLHDPYLGPDLALPVEAFEAMWATVDHVPGRKDRWALAVRDPMVSRS